jgi:uncharacterized membrane protein
MHANLTCSITGGCEKVLNSNYATIFHIPVALFGVAFYLFMLTLSIHFLLNKLNKKIIFISSLIGFASVIYLISLQAFVLKAWCQYCLVADISAIIIFALSTIIFLRKDENDKKA